MSIRPTEPIRAEHRELRPHIDRLREIADRLDRADPAVVRGEVEDAYAFLSGHLAIHARAEEAVLYPEVARVMGAPMATATMSRDHVAILGLVDELGVVRHIPDERARDLRRILYGLHALIATHFAKEEEIFLSLLDERLTADEAARMYARMEEAAKAARARA